MNMYFYQIYTEYTEEKIQFKNLWRREWFALKRQKPKYFHVYYTDHTIPP